MHKRHEETTHKQVNNRGEPSCPPLRLAPCAGSCRKITTHEHKWQGLKCKVPPDFCQETEPCARLGILRTVQQLGAPVNLTLAAVRAPARRLAPSTPRARNQAASSSEDGAAQGGVRAQALVPLHAGRMGSYQPKLRRAPPRPEPLRPATARPLQPFGRSSRIFDQK